MDVDHDAPATDEELEQLPQAVGLCPGEDAGEFYMPDAKTGDICPMCPRPLVIYSRDQA